MPQPWEQFQQVAPTQKQPWEQFSAPVSSDSYQPDATQGAYQGTMNNVAKPINNAFSNLYDQLGKLIPPQTEQALNYVGNDIVNSPGGIAAGKTISHIKKSYEDLNSYDANGNLSHDVSALGENAKLLPNLLGAKPLIEIASPSIKVGSAAFENASRKLPGILGDVSSGAEKTNPISIDALDAAKNIRYANADVSGALIKPEGTNSLIDMAKKGVGYQTPEGQAFAGSNVVTDTLDRLDTLRDKPISLQGLDEIDGKLQSDISVSKRAGDNAAAKKLSDIRDTLRNARANLSPEHLMNPEGFDHWRAGDTLFAAKSKMQELQNIVDSAYQTANPDTAMRTGYRNLYKRLQKNPMGYTPEEIAAIGKGASMSLPAAALKTLGGRLMSGVVGGIGGAAGGGIPGAFAGAAIGEGIGYPMRVAGNAIQEARAAKPISMVAARPAVAAALPQSVADIIKLPMSEQKAALEALFETKKNIPAESPTIARPVLSLTEDRPMVGGRGAPLRPATDAEWQNMIDNATNAQNSGLTSDVQRAQQAARISQYERDNPANNFFNAIGDQPFRINQTALHPQTVSDIVKLPMAQQKAALEALFQAKKGTKP